MRSVVVHRPGGYDRLCIESAPDPIPGPGEVRVRVQAIGVNYADCIVRMGLYESAKKLVGWPVTPGFEVAGVVDALGDGVTDTAPGSTVLALSRFGGYATHVVVPRHRVFAVPPGFEIAEAATFPTVYLTAYYALHELAHPRPGAKILVHSAAGGVGCALLQLGKLAGFTMVAVVGDASKVDVARRFGADAVIDKSREPLWPAAERHAPSGYDVVLDANGVSTLRESYRHLRSPGKLVVYGFHSMLPRARTGSAGAPGAAGRVRWLPLARAWLRTPRFSPLALPGDNKSVLGMNLSYLFEERAFLDTAMAALLGWARDGSIAPLRVRTFAFDAVADAHRALESALTVGKLALVP
jgi:NADPH:quinone reductase-like Zn-dependent oxidoreductase